MLAAVLLFPADASARKVEDASLNSVIPLRVDHLIGFTPTTFAIHPSDDPIKPIRVRYRGKTHRYVFSNASAVVAPSAGASMKSMIAGRRFPSPMGIFLDRKLTRKERRHVRVRADLGRDADTLAAAAGHPACEQGVSRRAARGIAAGRITRWSEAGVRADGADAIRLRRAGPGSPSGVEPRFGASAKLPKGAKAARDGGLAEAASGDQSIAAVTSWSRARGFATTTCAVPVGGRRLDDDAVRRLSHPDAYPIAFVTLKRLKTAGPIVAAFVKYLRSRRASNAFRDRGMLLVKDRS